MTSTATAGPSTRPRSSKHTLPLVPCSTRCSCCHVLSRTAQRKAGAPQHSPPPDPPVEPGNTPGRPAVEDHLWRVLVSPITRVLKTSSLLPRRTIAQSCSTRTPSRRKDTVCIPLTVPAQNDCEWALEGLVARARFRRPVDGGFSHFTIMSVHINHQERV